LLGRISEGIRLGRCCLVLLLFLESAEKQIEQAFGSDFARRKPKDAGESSDDDRHTPPQALIGQLDTQRLLHPAAKNSAAAVHCPARLTLERDGKRAMSKGREA
jgi:hypothetical protein